ncbi:RNA pseudouridine synthase [Variovorax sp. PCZ-1]|uniref:RNA pseudouridine synthase n=1 Tax=Variovorax sp. PCZ-1 TaxID=2835533 RepID=UPI001BCB5AFB|nr:RNA pseudouridine synthase [Variovorax sp. PCZ-1]MBS7806819.1 RNA-binding protein [Variovorax sp. PCZ-1]
MSEPIRLAKRLAEQLNCSRSQAEQYIEGGWVRVNGVIQESPQHRVTDEKIELDKNATLLESVPMTILLHKPPGYSWDDGKQSAVSLLEAANRSASDTSGLRLLKKHLKSQTCVTPLESGASGLLVFSQDFRVQRKLWDDANFVENEVIVDVQGGVSEELLQMLNRPFTRRDRLVLHAKVALSKSNEKTTGLRFATKGAEPGRIAALCEHHGLRVMGMKRIRVGRVPLADLPVGQWRFLQSHERF